MNVCKARIDNQSERVVCREASCFAKGLCRPLVSQQYNFTLSIDFFFASQIVIIRHKRFNDTLDDNSSTVFYF